MKEPKFIKSLETRFNGNVALAILVARHKGQEATCKRKGESIQQAVNRCLGWFYSEKWFDKP